MSLTSSSVAVMLPISDPDRAREFYSDRLGLPYEGTNSEQSLLYRLASGAQLVLLPRPDQEPSPSTALSFEVADIEAEVAALEGRGVAFDDYDLPDLKTVDHVCVMASEKAAWFRDPHGNVLCMHQNL
ncbi:VOC family protein [Nocardioides marmoriginsengisoli]|uniref:VOC family protein n=1 Tax=Nocardioides marmoriginsengisoli TaxID=661483 RepID=A0A3N0CPG9_9ACTN|nr:VOC family protein [Nocardioides marmoriginsengisoli]RNL65358.1 VOC family protein [Nocardioides marmoriginsengisoli]